MNRKIFFLLVAISILSCNKKSDEKKTVSVKDTLNKNAFQDEYEESEGEGFGVSLKELQFPKTGKNVEAFVLEPCEIKMKVEGFLNDDNLKDIVIVLQNRDNREDSRATLVLLQQEVGGYKLQELSWEAVGPEYPDYQRLGEISIDAERKLHILLEGTGPVGNREATYKFINDKLVLVNIGTFHTGAGSWLSSEYDLISGKYDHEVTNTLHDSVPSEHQIGEFKLKRQMLFANDNPDTIVETLPHANW
ncbi:hypothetical protein SAMN06265349_102253 [Flavobacterium resistens]|uniref:Lipoprotein n=1 Tax=Flavobacterium resistens TaxID=443612 RepID=A0A521C6Q1_9FLAO|nr:hypothetical protein [Flavobacterium resistens]MRX66360.1 hypothetical protein [Flavobacterium resistens]SMO55116.1 hypothetical protein SAMN06265349_102253 [Flavobacterium resistens]